MIKRHSSQYVFPEPCWQGERAELGECTPIHVDGRRAVGSCSSSSSSSYCWAHITSPVEGWLINFYCEVQVS